ncbi:MAG: hypothetical protein L3J30_14425 [Marinosulfonomonas sp.]|nr:hypothetical protein [Marinosulfonomonas sp.]
MRITERDENSHTVRQCCKNAVVWLNSKITHHTQIGAVAGMNAANTELKYSIGIMTSGLLEENATTLFCDKRDS